MLLEDFPGLAKTLLAKHLCSCTGGVSSSEFNLHPIYFLPISWGHTCMTKSLASSSYVPVHCFPTILLADEINRAPPKTQAALLEAMEGKASYH